MEKRAVIDENTPPETSAEKEARVKMRADRLMERIVPPLTIKNNELDRSDMSTFEAHVSKRLADKVKEASDAKPSSEC
jgi:hypothetical protein